MKIADLIVALNLKVYSGKNGINKEVKGGYVSDLLSDVMGNAREGEVWITLQTHKNILAVASLKDLAAVILVKGQKPDPETLKKSEEENIPVLGTDDSCFQISGRMYEILNIHEAV